MQAVMLSIHPKPCAQIASYIKTIEVRKTKPKIDVPFKCYIYETKHKLEILTYIDEFGEYYEILSGKVIGEFICDRIINIDCDSVAPFDADLELYIDKQCQLSREDFWNYTKGKCAYGWHISQLKIYDKPKELSEFLKYGFEEEYSKREDLFALGKPVGCEVRYSSEPKEEEWRLTRPPQSWCYVEELR